MANQYLLQENDIFRLEEGMKVYAFVPEKFVFVNAPFSEKLHEHAICIGSPLTKRVPDKDELISGIQKQLGTHMHLHLSSEQIERFIESLNLNFGSEEFDTSVFLGEYRVYTAAWNGGTHDGADAWHVYCHKVNNPNVVIHFYQTGDSTATNPNIQPISKAK